MVPERVLLGGVGVVVVVSVVVAGVAPGALDPPEDDVRPSRVDVREVTITPGTVSGDTATLRVETRLAHRGGPAENVSVLLRATDLRSGFVETTRTLPVERIADEREVAVTGNLSVEREGGYRIEAIVFQDGKRVSTAGKEVRGVGSLTPEYARTPVRFHRFRGDLPVIEYSVAEAGEDRTALRVSAYLTNTGDGPAGDLRLVLKARQADSNIVAAETAVDVGPIDPGATATPGADLTVPAGYNYYLDAILWKGDVIVGTARSAANLNPTETISVNRTRREIGLEVSDFERTVAERRAVERTATPVAAAQTGGQPGFTAAGAALALLSLLAGLLWRRSR